MSPYLGVGALKPAFIRAQQSNRGVYVLAATSNPEAVALQSSSFSAQPKSTIAQHVADEVRALNMSTNDGADPSIGLVIGATVKNPPTVQVETGPLLIPGYGAQGGTATDVHDVMGAAQWGALVNVSRQILRAGPTRDGLRQATVDVMRELEKLGKL